MSRILPVAPGSELSKSMGQLIRRKKNCTNDHMRTQFLQKQKYRIFRVSNDEVMNGMDEVLILIREEIGRES